MMRKGRHARPERAALPHQGVRSRRISTPPTKSACSCGTKCRAGIAGRPARSRAASKTFDDMVARDWNHPSIVIQTLINEAWGIDMTKADQRAGLRAVVRGRARRESQPLGPPDRRQQPVLRELPPEDRTSTTTTSTSRFPTTPIAGTSGSPTSRARPAWSYSPHGDASRTGKEPLVVSEFGNWGLPELPQTLPWWFPRDFDGRAITRPAGLFDRFKALGFYRAVSATTRRWRRRRSGASSRASSTRSSRCAATSRFAATSSRSSPTSTGKRTA